MIKLHTSSKTEMKERQFLELHDLKLHVSKVFWQQFDILIYFTPLATTEKQTDSCLSSRDIYHVASPNFSRKKKKRFQLYTHVAPRSRWVSLWSASASAPESAGKASSLWRKGVLKQACSTPHHIHSSRFGGGILSSGVALSYLRDVTMRLDWELRLPAWPQAPQQSTPRSWLGVFVPENTL